MKKRIILTAVVLVGIAAAVVLMRRRTVDDHVLKAALVGKWRALDVENSALHNHRDGGVASEEVVFSPDGTLVYRVVPKAGQGEPQIDTYSWEIVKGKLQLRYTGAGSTQDTLPRLKVIINGSRLSVDRHSFSTKVFERAAS